MSVDAADGRVELEDRAVMLQSILWHRPVPQRIAEVRGRRVRDENFKPEKRRWALPFHMEFIEEFLLGKFCFVRFEPPVSLVADAAQSTLNPLEWVVRSSLRATRARGSSLTGQ